MNITYVDMAYAGGSLVGVGSTLLTAGRVHAGAMLLIVGGTLYMAAMHRHITASHSKS